MAREDEVRGFDRGLPEPMATRANVIEAMQAQGSSYRVIGKALGGLSHQSVMVILRQYRKALARLQLDGAAPTGAEDPVARLALGVARGEFVMPEAGRVTWPE